MAGPRLMLGYSAFVLLLTGLAAGTIYGLWAHVSPWIYNLLNNCTDKTAEVGEQAYSPSQEVVRCTQDVHITTLILTIILLVLLLCAVVAALALASVEYVERAYAHVDKLPPAKLTNRLMNMRRSCGYAALAAVVCLLIILVPLG